MPQVGRIQDYSRLSVQAGQELYSNNVQITNGYQSPILDIVGFAFVNLSVAGIINVNWIVAQLVWYKDNLASISRCRPILLRTSIQRCDTIPRA